MAKVRTSINPLYTGAAGGYTFYVRKSEQVVRQRKNNSNYGEDASRTVNQQTRRIKWANLVNFYKAIKAWQPKAYEFKTSGQTDYNVFMSLNIERTTVALTKNMALNGCAVVEAQKVSRGSLPQIMGSTFADEGNRAFDLDLTNAISSTTTVGQFAQDFIANNPEFQEGDNLAIITFLNERGADNFAYVRSIYSEVTLDVNSTKLFQSIQHCDRLSKSSFGKLQFELPTADDPEVGMTLIHTRKTAGSLLVSSQFIFPNGNQFANEYTGQEWYDECIASYGVDVDVPLDPSFRLASIQSVTANGSAVRNASTLQGSQELIIRGSGLTTNAFRLTFNDTVYTPLESGTDYVKFIIGDNGVVRLFLNDTTYMSFRVEGVVVPTDIPSQMSMSQSVSPNGAPVNTVQGRYSCINYPYLVDEENPYYKLLLSGSTTTWGEADFSDFEGHNCTIERVADASTTLIRIAALVDDEESVAYITYQGFIIAVFNYTD